MYSFNHSLCHFFLFLILYDSQCHFLIRDEEEDGTWEAPMIRKF